MFPAFLDATTTSAAAAALLLPAVLALRLRRRAVARARAMSTDLDRLALVVRNTFDAVVITDARRRITWVNPAFERITGYAASEAIGCSPGRMLQCEQTDGPTIERLRRALDAGEVFSGALLNRAKDGRCYWIELVIQPIRTADGQLSGFMAIETDITVRRAMEADLQRHAQLLSDAIATIDEAFVVFDPDDRIVFFNDKYREVYAMSSDLIQLGARFEDIVRTGAERGQYAAARGRIDDWVRERVAQHRAGNTQLEQQLADGRWMRIIERRTPDGHTVGFRVDITDLVRATEAAERANRAKSEFIATISHELRTPLQSVIGFSELGLHFPADHEQLKPMFTDILAGGRRMLTLVNGLLDVSKLEGSSGSALSLRRSDLVLLTAGVVHELRHLAAERGVRIEGPDSGQPLPVDVDSFRIQQVLRNVLANAIRFAPAGSLILLAGRSTNDCGVLLTVRDHGPGIPPNELDAIFEPFVQSSRTHDGSGGSGLGLTICRKIMRAHGGRIEAANADGGGALMTLWLPAPTNETSPATAPAALRSPDLPIEA